MKKHFAQAVAALSMLCLSGSAALAGGLELREQGAVAVSMADAVTARLEDPSTVYFNPAGMAFLDGLQVSAGATLIFPDFNWADPDGNLGKAGSQNTVEVPPHLYASWKINEMWAVGLSVNAPFGLGVEWPQDFAGRKETQHSAMSIFLINPNVSIKPFDGIDLAFAAGIQLLPSTVSIKRSIGGIGTASGQVAEGKVELGGFGFGVGGNLGIAYRPLDWLYLGYFYRSAVHIEFNGDADFQLPEGVRDESIFHDQKIKGAVTLPHYMTWGIGFMIAERVYLEFDLDFVMWSTVDEIDMDFPDDESGQLSTPMRQDWMNTWTPRFGAEWLALDLPEHVLKVRGGGGYDMEPTPDHTMGPMLPDSQRVYGTLGLGYTYVPARVTLDIGFMFTKFLERTTDETDCDGGYCNPFPGTYDSNVKIVSIDVSWQVF